VILGNIPPSQRQKKAGANSRPPCSMARTADLETANGTYQMTLYDRRWPIVLKKSPKTGKAPIRFETETKKSNKNNAKNISVYG
jgi:hypothetical protein